VANTTSTAPPALERRLGPFDGAAIIVSNVIGAGILFTPPVIAAGVPGGLMYLSVWLAGGLLAFAGAMAYAELAALRPRAGGEYVYLRDAFGRLAAFLTGWTSFVAGFSGAIAAVALVLPFYLARFTPAAGNTTPFFSIPIVPGVLALSFSAQTVIALALIWGLAVVHLRGVGPGFRQQPARHAEGARLRAVYCVGLRRRHRQCANIADGGAGNRRRLVPCVAGGRLHLLGLERGGMAEEIRDPGRNVPRALALGTGAVVAIYLLMNALYLYVVPVAELATLEGSVLDIVADRLIGPMAGNIMGIVGIISLAASVNAMTFAGPRVYFAMARDGLFFTRAASVHATYKTPAFSILAQTAWASLLVLTAQADRLINYTGFAIWLFSGLAVAALFVLRRREPNADRPFRTWGYPVVPALYALVAAIVIVNGLIPDPDRPAPEHGDPRGHPVLSDIHPRTPPRSSDT
jgi:APA family basic amino acid/polyamine antiporter